MRLLVVGLLALALVVPAALVAGPVNRGSFSIEQGSGTMTIRGRGVLLGRLERGQIVVTDLSPRDQWTPRVNGVTRIRTQLLRAREVTFYVPGGRYRIVLRGEGISVSARGVGDAVLAGEPNGITGETGTYWVGDDEPKPVPDTPTSVLFGDRTPAANPS